MFKTTTMKYIIYDVPSVSKWEYVRVVVFMSVGTIREVRDWGSLEVRDFIKYDNPNWESGREEPGLVGL